MRSYRGLYSVAVVLLAAHRNACGQEALRISTQGDLAATQAAREREGQSLGYYNFLVGPTAWNFSSGLGLVYNDNVHQTSANEQGSFIVEPSANAQMHWPVTLNNSLDFSLNAGYLYYLSQSGLNRLYVNPGTGLSFDVYVGDCKINVHDRLQVTQFTYQNPGVNSGGGENLESLDNTAGVSAMYDFGRLLVNSGYDHVDYIQLNTSTLPDTTAENFYANAGLPVRPEVLVGVEVGGSLINYSYSGAPNYYAVTSANQWKAGIFGSTQISDYLSARLDMGYTEYLPGSTVGGQIASDNSGYYFSLSATHKVNQWFNYTLTAGQSTDLSSAGQVQTRTYVQLAPNYLILNGYTISTPFSYQAGTRPTYTSLNSSQSYDQYVIGLSVSRMLTKKLTVSLSYQWVNEDSPEASLVYTVNMISLNSTYKF